MRVVGYIRVSTSRQGDDGISLDAQRKRLPQYCELHGHELVDVITDVASAKDMHRPGWARVLELIASKAVEGVLVPKLDRLTRSVRDLDDMMHGVFNKEKGGAVLMAIDDFVDTSSANARMVTNLVAVFAQWERERISERTKEALAELKAQGVRCTSRAPLGMRMTDRVDARGHRIWEIVPEELETARLIVALHKAGLNTRMIADRLIELGARTKRGGKWRAQTVRTFLKSAPTVLAMAEGSQRLAVAEVAATT